MTANLENAAVATKLEKVSFHSNPKECSIHSNPKECSNYSKIALISHASSNPWKLGFDSMWTENFQMFKLDLEKTEESEMKLPTSVGSLKKQESSRKHLLLLH